MKRWELIKKGWLGALSHIKIYISHDEIQQIASAASPAIALANLIASFAIPGLGGPVISAIASAVVWLLKRADEKHGNRGACLIIPFGWGPPILDGRPLGYSITGPD